VWWVGKNTPIKTYADSSEDIQRVADSPPTNENRLFVPSLGMDEVIHEGGLEELKFGVLRRSRTSTPDKGSNTVMVGHRFTYGSRGVFYHLDKVKTGDSILLHWEGKPYRYMVKNILVVSPSQINIEEPTGENILTLYTCTPLWSAKDRLVIQAVQEEGDAP
jgi:sortase A